MSVLLLVRHGQASFTSDDYDRLSDVGHEQGRVLGRSLAARGVDPALVVRGSLRRHRETAGAAVGAAGWSSQVEVDPDWDEFDHVSTITGLAAWEPVPDETYEQRLHRLEAAIERWSSGDHDADYHESFPAFRARVADALDRTLDRLGPDDTGVVFTSGGPVSWVAAALVDGGVPVWSSLSRVVVNSSVSKVLVGRRGTTLISFNDHSHLETEPGLLTYR